MVTPIGGGETVHFGQEEVRLSHQVKTYWRPDLASLSAVSPTATAGHNMRLVWGSRVLDIQIVQDPDSRMRVLLLFCLEHQD